MENPATWDYATQVVDAALRKADKSREARMVGLSRAAQIVLALREEGLLIETPKR